MAGNGAWQQLDNVAAFFTKPDAPDRTIPIDGKLVAADESSIYVQVTDDAATVRTLFRYPTDGGSPVKVAEMTVRQGPLLLTYVDFGGPFGTFAPLKGDGVIVKVWLVPSAADPNRGELLAQVIPAR